MLPNVLIVPEHKQVTAELATRQQAALRVRSPGAGLKRLDFSPALPSHKRPVLSLSVTRENRLCDSELPF